VAAIALVLAAGLVLATGAQAKPRHQPLKCKAGYTRHTVWIPQRAHGRIVRRHGRIVRVQVQRCVKRPTTKSSSPTSHPGGTLAGPTTTRPPVTSTGPSPTPSPSPSPSPAPPANTALPVISGTTSQGSVLTASTGNWSNSPAGYAYQWQLCSSAGTSCTSVSGQTGSTYLAGGADVGSTIRVLVSAGNASGSASATSAAFGPIVAATGDPVVVAVGDISCPAGDTTHSCQQAATQPIAQQQNPSAVFVLGDTQYDSGTLSEYQGSGAYNSTWGIFNPIVRPTPGNHEYGTSGAAGYFQYFGQATANPQNTPGGYYSFNLGSWHILALNSNCSDQSGCADALTGGTTSAQTAWVKSDLAANQKPCVLAMWHHPLFSSGWTLGTPGVAPLWSALYSAHADVVLNGHDHLYERYAQVDPSGNATSSGIREFVVGTGGESLNGRSTSPTTLQASDFSHFGVLVLTLHASSYDWKFVSTNGTVQDSGTTACHGSGATIAAAGSRRRATPAAPVDLARLTGPALVFDASPLRRSLASVKRTGLPVAVLTSRAVDVAVTAWLRHGHRLTRLASFYETESQITNPHSVIRLRLPADRLTGMRVGTLVLRFAAEDGAGHRHTVTRTVRLR
jgi:hypothetical protein